MDKKKVKVLHIVEAMGGGVFTYLVELANGMCDEFDVTIAFGLRQETPTNYEDYFDKKIKLIRVMCLLTIFYFQVHQQPQHLLEERL